jgi:hypothetical protein
MKPGEFVNWEGKPAKVEYVGVRTLDDNYCLFPEQADFPAAVAALQALIQPSLDPEQCCNCRFWWHQSEGGRFINGWCRRHPPAPAFPGSLPDDWCGEYERERG